MDDHSSDDGQFENDAVNLQQPLPNHNLLFSVNRGMDELDPIDENSTSNLNRNHFSVERGHPPQATVNSNAQHWDASRPHRASNGLVNPSPTLSTPQNFSFDWRNTSPNLQSPPESGLLLSQLQSHDSPSEQMSESHDAFQTPGSRSGYLSNDEILQSFISPSIQGTNNGLGFQQESNSRSGVITHDHISQSRMNSFNQMNTTELGFIPNTNSRDENMISYNLSQLVGLSGTGETNNMDLSSQTSQINPIIGGILTQRLPSISPINNLDSTMDPSPIDSPISRDYISPPMSRANSHLSSRSPSYRRSKATQQDIICRRYFRQVMYGCGKEDCQKSFCAGNPNFIPRDISEASALSLTLSHHGEEHICPDVPEFDPSDNSSFPLPIQKTLRSDFARDSRRRHRNVKTWASIVETTSNEHPAILSFETIKALHSEAEVLGSFDTFAQTLYSVFSRINELSRSFNQSNTELRLACPLDVEQVRETYLYLVKKCPKLVLASVLKGTATLFEKLKLGLEVIREQHLTALIIVLMNPLLLDPSNHHDILPRFCDIFSVLSEKYIIILSHYLKARKFLEYDPEKESRQCKEDFQHIISVMQQFVTMRLLLKSDQTITPNKDEYVMKATACLGMFYRINEANKIIDYTEFYNDAVNEQIEIKEDFPRFRSRSGFSFCNYPFILTPATKSDILKVESMFQMRQELQDAFFRALFIGVNSPYLVLEIRRDHIIRDALIQLSSKSAQDLKKQLRVQFIGEEGVDEGGVQKEFFQLLVRDMLDPKYGMFVMKEETNLFWFNPNPLDDDLALDEYRLIGRLIGLAIYNSVILDLHFPIALYKKLMGRTVNIDDLEEIDKSLGRGLKDLLTFEEDVESAYGWTFQIEYEVVGERFKYDLKPEGAEIPLNNENRKEFIQLYVDFILNKSIERQFLAFKEGFDHVCGGSAIQLFRPEEVEQLVCGSADLDFEALEKVTQYDGGFGGDTPVIQAFWRIVHSFTEIQKKKLLFFATGSDRVPIGGLSKLQFVIAKNGPDSDRLPTSHTCFNVLLLCEYSSEEKLQERLLTAIHNAEGFGMI